MTFGFLGFGKMASALVQGMLQANACKPEEILVVNRHPETIAKDVEQYGLRLANSPKALVQQADTIVLGTKPADSVQLLRDVRQVLDGKLLISAAEDNQVKVWDWQAGVQKVHLQTVHTKWPLALAISPDGNLVASGGLDGAVVVLATFVMPRFKDLFKDINADLPLTTRFLLGITDFVSTWWWAILIGIVVLLGALYGLFGGRHGEVRRHRLLLNAPGLGPLLHFVILERFCRVLASMAAAGVPLTDALHVATESLRNRVFIRSLSRVNQAMLEAKANAIVPDVSAQILEFSKRAEELAAKARDASMAELADQAHALYQRLQALAVKHVIHLRGVRTAARKRRARGMKKASSNG